MALGSTICIFDIRLSDGDRGVYETLSLRVARHPSETAEYLLTRVLAYCLEFTEGIAFSNGGLSEPEEPTLSVRDLTGALRAWIEIGTPDAARLHKAGKAAARVARHGQRAEEGQRMIVDARDRVPQLRIVIFNLPEIQRAVRIAHQIGDAIVADRDSEVLRRDVFEVMGLVEN